MSLNKENITMYSSIQSSIVAAMKSKDSARLQYARALKNEIDKYAKDNKEPTTDETVKKVSLAYYKKLEESRLAYEKAKADTSYILAEMAFVEKYIPASLSNDDVMKLVDAALIEGNKKIGEIMKFVKEHSDGKVLDNKFASDYAKSKI